MWEILIRINWPHFSTLSARACGLGQGWMGCIVLSAAVILGETWVDRWQHVVSVVPHNLHFGIRTSRGKKKVPMKEKRYQRKLQETSQWGLSSILPKLKKNPVLLGWIIPTRYINPNKILFRYTSQSHSLSLKISWQRPCSALPECSVLKLTTVYGPSRRFRLSPLLYLLRLLLFSLEHK